MILMMMMMMVMQPMTKKNPRLQPRVNEPNWRERQYLQLLESDAGDMYPNNSNPVTRRQEQYNDELQYRSVSLPIPLLL